MSALIQVRILSFLVAAILLSSVTSRALAQDDYFGSIDVAIGEEESSDSAVSVIGWVTEKVAWGLEQPDPIFSRSKQDFAKIETSLFGQLDYELSDRVNLRISGKAYHDEVYRVTPNTPYSDSELNTFRNRFEVRDAYFQREFDNGSFLKVGNQIAAWGLSEYLRVTDLVNTEDQFTLGQQDLEDIRLQVPGILYSFSAGDWVIDSLVTYGAGRDNIAPAGDEFDQFLQFRNAGLGLNIEKTDNDQEFEYFFRASTHYDAGDIQVVYAEFNENSLSVNSLEGLRSVRPIANLGQNRSRALGVALNYVTGPWLVFAEGGVHTDKAIRPHPDAFFAQVDGWQQENQVLGVLGLEYTGFSNLLLSLEVDSVHTTNHSRLMFNAQDQIGAGIRAYWTALNERLEVLAVWNALGDNAGHVSRLSMDYKWSDNFEFGFMWVDYHATRDSFVYNFRNNDVLQFQLRYSFQY